MIFISSDNPFFNKKTQGFSTKFWEFFKSASRVEIAVGYVNEETLDLLCNSLAPKQEILLVIGQHFQEGITPGQLASIRNLSRKLSEIKAGSVLVFPPGRYHGKVYRFFSSDGCKTIIGSSNLSNIAAGTSHIEVDVVTENHPEVDVLFNTFKDLGRNFADIRDEEIKIVIPEPPLTGFKNVFKMDSTYTEDIQKNVTGPTFLIPIKTEPKSNLNVFNGAGRKKKDGTFLKRNWYEAELIVEKGITEEEGYPRGEHFLVVTDDNFMFECTTSGDNFKNFRSVDDLCILGKWIKGKMVGHNCLKENDLITEETLEKYGNSHLHLQKTDRRYNDLDIWSLEFKFKGTYEQS